jgi:hypothetical protein
MCDLAGHPLVELIPDHPLDSPGGGARPATLRGTRHVRRTRQTMAPACLEFSVEEPLPAVSPKAVGPQYS